MLPSVTRHLLLPLLMSTAACDTTPGEEAGEAPGEGAAAPEEGGLASYGLNALEEQRVAFTLPWVGGPVNREPTTGADAVTLEEVTLLEGAGFDRVLFRFSEGAFPGYNLEWAPEPPVDCLSEQPIQMEGLRYLRILLRSVEGGQGDPEPGFERVEGSNPAGIAVTCIGDGDLTWHLGLVESGDLRVVEMRDPLRLLVDVRRPGA